MQFQNKGDTALRIYDTNTGNVYYVSMEAGAGASWDTSTSELILTFGYVDPDGPQMEIHYGYLRIGGADAITLRERLESSWGIDITGEVQSMGKINPLDMVTPL